MSAPGELIAEEVAREFPDWEISKDIRALVRPAPRFLAPSRYQR
jgi:hypothetical protein